MKTVSESIYSSKSLTIPMADVQHIEKQYHSCDLVNGAKKGDLQGAQIITKHTAWNFEYDTWENAIWLATEEYKKFNEAWCYYRRELEISTLAEQPKEQDK